MTALMKKAMNKQADSTPNRDLTVGDPQTVLWRFCLPMFGRDRKSVV